MDNSNRLSPTQSEVVSLSYTGSERSVDLSALKFVVCVIAIVAIPSLIYTFFLFAFRSSSSQNIDEEEEEEEEVVKCPVCLAELGSGNQVKHLTACGHSFHTECVNEWLSSQSRQPNCPVCRAPVSPADFL